MTLQTFLNFSINLVSSFASSSIGEISILGTFSLGLLIAIVHVIHVIIRVN